MGKAPLRPRARADALSGETIGVPWIMPAPCSAAELITTDLYGQRGRSSLVAIMRNSRLSFVFGVAAPIVLGWSGCFIATEGETYDDTYGTAGDDEGSYECDADHVGWEGCACTSGGACNEPFLCNPNLDRCIADTCPTGEEGCECTSGGNCNPDLQCLSGFCVDNACPTGEETCTCTPGGGCDPGLECAGFEPGRVSGVCIDPSDVSASATDDDDDASDSVDSTPPDTGDSADESTTAAESSTGTPDPDTSGTGTGG
jgi:hypothetical protein